MKLLRLLGLLSLMTAVNAGAGNGVWIDLYVDSGDVVVAGQKLAVQRNTRGRIVQEYTAGTGGRVQVAVRGEPGETVLEIHTRPESDDCAEENCPQVVAH